ncbi:hypothetical protein [Paenibacillus planticolens]|uniref:Uncharacterized protein n=1 Tax=Paenibacillus planticolens TaxID=2654976 RepID=A0ABX1ZUT0_9BACL|nr:hypothetical protein [Paenibacillus planticolens]NOV03779.1 hypothetical protein [Paenibacillus planticolens]
MPNKNLDVVVLNKTFPLVTNVSGGEKQLDYSKQRGLYWLMGYLGIKNPETNKKYEVNTDYYGNFLNNEKLVNKPLQKLTYVPDVIYLSDTYGTGNSKINGVEPVGVSGMTKEEVALVATSYAKGTTVIGEYNIAGDPTKTSVSKELGEIFGVNFTGLAGKFFSDLSSTADVPNWMRATYEQQYGKKWSLTGAGIVIAGNNRIVVLQRGIGFTGNSLQIYMTENAKTYGKEAVDYYNWFEIVKPVDEDSIIAWYDLHLTEEGKNQLNPFGLDTKLPAIIAKHTNNKHSFYFAGDFTDYRGPDKIKRFLGATTLYRYFSVNSEGDLSYFYWHFYVPLMSKLFKDIKPLEHGVSFKAATEVTSDGSRLSSKIDDKQFSVYQNGQWKKLYVKGVDIGRTVPGNPEGTYPDDPAFYSDWFEKIANMNANAIRVYTRMPAVFYRALDIYNDNHPDNRLYLFQNIAVDQEPPAGNYLDKAYHAAVEKSAEDTINAIHGNATIESADGKSSDVYINDVSGYVLGYLITPDLSSDRVAATDAGNPSYRYTGEYVSAGSSATPTESWLAAISNKVYEYEQQSYQMQHPAGIVSIPELDRVYQDMYNAANGNNKAPAVTMNHLDTTNKVTSGLFGAYNMFPDQPVFRSGEADEAKPSYAGFKAYLNNFMKTQNKYPVLISEFGLPTSAGSTEDGQGSGIVSLIAMIKDSGAMGGLIYEWADEWGASSKLTSPLMIPYNRGPLWHNVVDPEQNYGVLAMESKIPKDYAMTLRGSDPLNTLAFNSDESYFYIKADFQTLPAFDQKRIMIYLDTIDRKNGEYMISPEGEENWSGAEFNINIDSQNKADLLVIPTYNTSKGSYFSSVSTTGIFEKMDGSTLIPGRFENSMSQFYVEGNTLNVRIPWTRLNFSDPSSLLVLSDEKNKGAVESLKEALSVRMTDGIVLSLVVMDKATQKVDYHFPESVTSSGYRTFSWNTWDIPQPVSRTKTSYNMIREAFAN